MTVSDRGTVGLGGPSRAGVRVEDDERADFVQFLRNVGEPRDQTLGGGTYGFGKGIYYTVSRASAILVDTHAVDLKAGRRLMGAAMTNKWAQGESVYTGRHGGAGSSRTFRTLRPVRTPLGSPPSSASPDSPEMSTAPTSCYSTPSSGCSTSCADARWKRRSPTSCSSMVWHLWPKSVEAPEGIMRFSTSIDGEETPLPNAEEIPALSTFVSALEKARRGDGHHYTRKSAPNEVGALALALSPASLADRSEFGIARPFEGPLRHIARMRQVELVVDYHVGEEHPDPRFGYAGVFLASREADDVFGRAEPPTHDAWVLEGLTGTDYGVVSQLKAFLRNRIQEEVQPKGSDRVRRDRRARSIGRSSRVGHTWLLRHRCGPY